MLHRFLRVQSWKQIQLTLRISEGPEYTTARYDRNPPIGLTTDCSYDKILTHRNCKGEQSFVSDDGVHSLVRSGNKFIGALLLDPVTGDEAFK